MNIEDIKDLIYGEIRDVSNGIRPKDSTEGTRHAPDAILIEKLITELILPILTGLVSGLLTYLSTEYSDKTEAEKIKSELEQVQQRLQAAEKEIADKNDTNEILAQIANELHGIRKKMDNTRTSQVVSDEITVSVSKVLEDYHLGQKTSQVKAKTIVRRIIHSLEEDDHE